MRDRIELLKAQAEQQLRQLEILLKEIPDTDAADRRTPAKERARKILFTTKTKTKDK